MALSGQVQDEVRQALKLQVMAGLPDRVSSFIQPVVEVNPHITKRGFVGSNSNTNSTSATLMTAPSDKDLFICSANLTFVRDATATSVLFAIQCTNEMGASMNLLSYAGVTLNAGTGSAYIDFPHPVKVQRGSNINITSSTNVANFKVTGQINYYLDETPRD